MHDILRLQRMVQQLASKVEGFMGGHEANSTDTKLLCESHHEIMALAEATFKEMSLQVITAYLDSDAAPPTHCNHHMCSSSIMAFALSDF